MSLPPLPPKLEFDHRGWRRPCSPPPKLRHVPSSSAASYPHHPHDDVQEPQEPPHYEQELHCGLPPYHPPQQPNQSMVFRPLSSHPPPPLAPPEQQQQQYDAVGSCSAKKIIDDINHAVTRSQRVLALQTACRAFSHSNEELHNYEIDMGALNALIVKLGYCLLLVQQQQHSSVWTAGTRSGACPTPPAAVDDRYEETALLTRAVQALWSGCSVDRRVVAFHSLGATELLPLLVQVLKYSSSMSSSSSCASNEWLLLSSLEQQRHRSETIHCTLQILRVMAKLDPAKSCLSKSKILNQALGELLWNLETTQDDHVWQEADNGTPSFDQLKLEVLGIWKELTFRMNDDDKRVLFETEGWLKPVCHVCRHSVTASSKFREYVASILWNLALSPGVSVDMACDSSLLSLLQYLTVAEDATAKTRRSAVSAIGNMATLTDNQETLVQQEGLLEALQTAAASDDTDCRRRAMRTIRCLMAGDAASNPWRQQESLIQFCAQVAIHDVDSATKIQACECLAHVASDAQAVELVGDLATLALMETIERSASDSKVSLAAFRGLSVCTMRPNELRLAAIKATPAFLVSLEHIVRQSNDSTVHRSAGRLVKDLSLEDSCRPKLTSTTVLNVLALLLSAVGPDFGDSRIDALQVINGLAKIESNRRPMAEHDALLTALVNFALAEEDNTKKDVAKQLILQLVPEL